jgi:UDP-N-acetylglucosamine--N-acetylmuramyl-(pentapeptide) pyrophosphoryl-undecaprenol N-acetylglucosamine transferase
VKVVLSGGGTGGHIYPALAVGEALREQVKPLELQYVGVRGRMDEAIVGRAGLPLATIRAAPLRVRSPLALLRGIFDLKVGTFQAWRLLRRLRPDVCLATGGYASVPVGIAARLRRVPLVVYLPDVRPGWSVRLLSRLATRIATTAERSLAELPPGKATAVGYPVRADFWSVDRQAARRELGLVDDAPALLVSGASQGAHSLNVAVAGQLDELLEVCQVVHLTGRADEADMQTKGDALPEPARARYHVFGYLDNMPAAMAAADLAVMRAGASVLGELPAAGLPAVLVPGVYEGGYDQTANARYLEEQGTAVVLPNDQLDRLSNVVRELLADDARRRAMAEAMRRLARPDASQRIAAIVRETAEAAA